MWVIYNCETHPFDPPPLTTHTALPNTNLGKARHGFSPYYVGGPVGQERAMSISYSDRFGRRRAHCHQLDSSSATLNRAHFLQTAVQAIAVLTRIAMQNVGGSGVSDYESYLQRSL